MMITKFILLSHTADLKMRVFGATYEQLFQHALCGMFSVMKPRLVGQTVPYDELTCEILPQKVIVEIQAPDQYVLLVDFLSQALCVADTRNEMYFDAQINSVTQTYIKAFLCGIQMVGCDGVEIKAVTYHDLVIEQTKKGWHADVVFDI